jgi:hypothetical protein
VWRRSCGDVRHGHGASYEAAGLDQVITVFFTLCSSLALLVSWEGQASCWCQYVGGFIGHTVSGQDKACEGVTAPSSLARNADHC